MQVYVLTRPGSAVARANLQAGETLTALAGAQVLFYPTAIGWLDGEEEVHL